MGDVKPKEPRISVRVDQDTKARLAKAVEDTGIDEPTLVKKCIEAMLRYVEDNGSITFPLEVLPSTAAQKRNPAEEGKGGGGRSRSYPPHNPEHTVVEDKPPGYKPTNPKLKTTTAGLSREEQQ